jgi:hypothetical protein
MVIAHQAPGTAGFAVGSSAIPLSENHLRHDPRTVVKRLEKLENLAKYAKRAK